MIELFAIGIGGALGAVSRFLLADSVTGIFGSDFPYGILVVNVVGSFFMGVCVELLVEATLLPAVWRSAIMVGFLGAFTTFSTFSMQVVGFLQVGRWVDALGYILGSVCLTVIAVIIGIFITRQLTA